MVVQSSAGTRGVQKQFASSDGTQTFCVFQTKPLVDGCYVEQFTEVALVVVVVVVVVGVGGFGVVVGVAVVVGVYRISKKLH